jgi:hypothetical protein
LLVLAAKNAIVVIEAKALVVIAFGTVEAFLKGLRTMFYSSAADSGHRDQPIRLIVITQTGDRDHAARLGRGVPGGQHGVGIGRHH